MSIQSEVAKRHIAERGLRRLSPHEWLSRRELFGGPQKWWQRTLLERLAAKGILSVRKPEKRGGGHATRYLLLDAAHLAQVLDHEESLLTILFPSSMPGQIPESSSGADVGHRESESVLDEAPTEAESPEYSDDQIQQAQLKILMGIAQETTALTEAITLQTETFNKMSEALTQVILHLDKYNATAEAILDELKGDS